MSGRSTRARALILVGLGLAVLLVAGVVTTSPAAAPALFGRGGDPLLPVVDLQGTASAVWSCPGPLPVGKGAAHAVIDLLDPGTRPAQVSLSMATTSPVSSSRPTSQSAPRSSLPSVTLPPGSQRQVSLPTSGAAALAVVTAVSSGAPVVVSESVSGSGPPLESPCELGTSATAYLPGGSTLDRSDVALSIVDPTATPAVVNVRVFGPSGATSPPALQGLSVPENGAVAVELGHFAVQQSLVALSVVAVTGHVTAGAMATFDSTRLGDGEGLEIAAGTTSDRWVLPPGPQRNDRTVLVRVLDPGPRPTTVTITSPFLHGPTGEVSTQVPAQSATAVALPIESKMSPPRRSSTGTGHGRLRAETELQAEGPITVLTTGGIGVVVARESLLPSSHGPSQVVLGSAPGEVASTWLAPGATATKAVGDQVYVGNAGSKVEQVVVSSFASGSGSGSGPGGGSGTGASSSGAPVTLAPFQLDPGGGVVIPLGASLGNLSQLALKLSASGRIVVEQVLGSTATRTTVTGVPATGSS